MTEKLLKCEIKLWKLLGEVGIISRDGYFI